MGAMTSEMSWALHPQCGGNDMFDVMGSARYHRSPLASRGTSFLLREPSARATLAPLRSPFTASLVDLDNWRKWAFRECS